MEGIFGLDSEFISTLNEEELASLSQAKATLDNVEKKYQKWQGGTSDDELKAYIRSKAAKEEATHRRQQELIKTFK